MYIACPECDTKFIVQAAEIGDFGRKVKCSKCAHIWHQTAQNIVSPDSILTALPQEVLTTPIASGVNLPAIIPDKIPNYVYFIPVILFALIVSLGAMIFPEKLGFGVGANTKYATLKITDLQITKEPEMAKINLRYKIYNSGARPIKLPLVRIRFVDKNGGIIKSLVDDHSKTTLSPGQYIGITTDFAPAKGAETVDITIGNRIDFIIR